MRGRIFQAEGMLQTKTRGMELQDVLCEQSVRSVLCYVCISRLFYFPVKDGERHAVCI